MKRLINGILFSVALATSTFSFATQAETGNTVMADATSTTTTTTAPTQTSFNADQTKDIQTIIHDYLVQHPEVLIEASQVLQNREMAKAQQQSMSAIAQNKQALFNDPNSPSVGSQSPNAVLVEFFDYQCQHCKNANAAVQGLLKKNPSLKVIFKELPIFGGNSNFAAKAALASAKQGKYQAFHDALMAADNPLSKEKILAIAKQVGLDISKLSTDMQSTDIQNEIRSNFQLAQALRLQGTPAFVVSDFQAAKFGFIPGEASQDDLQKQIDTVTTAGTSTK